MDYVVFSVLCASLLLSGCVATQAHTGTDTSATYSDSGAVQYKGESEYPGGEIITKRLKAIKLSGNDYINGKDVPVAVSVGEGFTKAMINDEPATITKKNPNFYEIKGSGYIVGVYLDEQGFMSSSWNHTKGRAHGGLNLIEDK